MSRARTIARTDGEICVDLTVLESELCGSALVGPPLVTWLWAVEHRVRAIGGARIDTRTAVYGVGNTVVSNDDVLP